MRISEKENREEINDKSQLIEYFEKGCKPPERWSIGTEHEKFIFHKSNFKRVGYDTPAGINTIFEQMQKTGWQPIMEKGNVTGLVKEGASVTLEPGGQFELSGKNFKTVKETFIESIDHFRELDTICQMLGLFSLPLGVDPVSRLEDVPWMPKERYEWMKRHMPLKGELGLEMMANTASIQVNLDYDSERDMIMKMRVAQALQPVFTAIFANSPFSVGKPNGYLSYRAHIWNNTDPDRCGFLPFIFDEGFGFERWVDYLLHVPMYFIHRGEEYLSANGMTFQDFLKGEHRLKPIMSDWETHVSTVFPDVRLKQFIEMRGMDAGCVSDIAAVAALWVGLLYDSNSLEEVYEIISGWDIETLQELRSLVPVKGLNAESGDIHAGKIAKQLYQIAMSGLARRSEIRGIENESRFLKPVKKITESGITQAEKFIQQYDKDIYKNLNGILYNWQKLRLSECSEQDI
ncbi:MAG: glutamate--cysteine ligase [Prolixibacteraceae bacterium]|jgi:glutamate--cysteine ligase|nr:glutamate--cysteine ligase [Prolixibacteraceae bacterium]